MIRKLLRVFILLAAVAFSAGGGCAYRLTDPATGRVFYTTDESTRWSLGPGEKVRFIDGRTGRTVVLDWPTIEVISRSEFEEATGR
ncbi:MAG: hypothetical protein V3U03_17490 [Myxococcota bacterium]